jgi:DUF4097 and DUF4098 domain-containing protein YvlB
MKSFFLVIIALLILSPYVSAQKRFSKTYPANRNVRLQLMNRSGTVTVLGWERNEVRITAQMEAPSAKIEPEVSNESLLINVVRDNQGRGDVGDVNFEVRVPFNSTVDIETKMGNLTVRDVSGSMVRAKISLEGDISLSNIKSTTVMADNMVGDIFFDGELQQGGTYRFNLTRGEINIRIPFTSSFRLAATAPSSRNIELGSFSTGGGLSFVSEGRKVIGNVGDGRASLTILNKRGNISFIKR